MAFDENSFSTSSFSTESFLIQILDSVPTRVRGKVVFVLKSSQVVNAIDDSSNVLLKARR